MVDTAFRGREKASMYSHRVEKKVCIVETGGALTLMEPHQFKSFVLELLEDHEYEGLIVNFNKLNRIDSFGIGVIVSLLKTAKEKGKTFAITKMSDSHRRLFTSTGLDNAIDIFDTDEDAITAMTAKD